jgi:hypothetical protein
LAIVIIGVAGEGIHDFTRWFTRTWWGPNGGRLSVLILIIGLAIEGIAQVKTNSTSDKIIAFLGKETADENERTAELKLALEKEITSRSPREIKPEQRTNLLTALNAVMPKGEITITAKLFDEEAERFEKQISDVLKEAGFDVKEVRGPIGGFGAMGQWIFVRDLKKFQTGPSWLGEIQAGLKNSLGLDFGGQQMDSTFTPEFGEVLIAVGAKP